MVYLKEFGSTCKDGFNLGSAAYTIAESVRLGNIQSKLAGVVHIGQNFAGKITVHIPPSQVANVFGALTKAEQEILIKSPEKLLATSSVTVFQKAMFVASVVMTVVDVKNLVSSWRSKHPLDKPIDQFIDALERDIDSYTNTIRILSNIKLK